MNSAANQNKWSFVHVGIGICCMILLAAMTLLTFIDVIGRYFFNAPVTGAFEITEVLLAALIFAALPLTTAAEEHVDVDMLFGVSPTWVKRVMLFLGSLFSAVVLWIIAWRLVHVALDQTHDGAVTNALGIPLSPIAWLAALSCVISGLLAFIRLFQVRQPISFEEELM